MTKSNDYLLCELIKQQTKQHPSLWKEELHLNPKRIEVAQNQIVYIHFFHSNLNEFSVTIDTSLDRVTLTRKNTFCNSSNLIIKSHSPIDFTAASESDFYVQLIRIIK